MTFRILTYEEFIAFMIGAGHGGPVYMYEGWQDELGIDFTTWAVTHPATGTAWGRGAAGAYLRAMSVPNANETARLVGTDRWIAAPGVYGVDTIIRRLVFEFEMRLTAVANLDNALSFFGFTPGQADNRGTNGIMGWGLLADALQSITDVGGVESVNTGFGEVLTVWNKYRMDIYSGHVVYSLNETQLADHVANLPDTLMYPDFFIDTEAGGAATIEIGIVRIWPEIFVP